MPLGTSKNPISGPKADDLEQSPEVPDAIPRDRWGRPLIIPVGGGKPVAYTRASTLGKAIEDTYHLNRWMQRSVAFGLSRRPDLLALVAAVATNEGEDRGPLDELCEKAHEAAKGDQGANVGTALHKLSERADAGEDLSYLPPILLEAIEAYREQMRVFEVLASETFVACDQVQTAGTFDRVVRLLVDLEHRNGTIPAGTVLVLDLKTGKAESAKYWGPTYGVQQAVYQAGDPYLPSGRITWEELLGEDVRPSPDWAVLLHIPSDSPKDAGLIVVDLEIGRAMADLCLEVRKARKSKELMNDAFAVEVPAVSIDGGSPTPGVEDVVPAPDLFALIAVANADDLDQLWEDVPDDLWGDEHTQAVKVRLAELAATKPEKPVQVVALELAAAIRQASDLAALDAIYEANEAVWTDAATRIAGARARELDGVTSGVAG